MKTACTVMGSLRDKNRKGTLPWLDNPISPSVHVPSSCTCVCLSLMILTSFFMDIFEINGEKKLLEVIAIFVFYLHIPCHLHQQMWLQNSCESQENPSQMSWILTWHSLLAFRKWTLICLLVELINETNVTHYNSQHALLCAMYSRFPVMQLFRNMVDSFYNNIDVTAVN